MRRKRLTIGLILVVLCAVVALATLQAKGGSGQGFNFAFRPAELLSVFKKAPEAPEEHPSEPANTHEGYQPLDVAELPGLPSDLPVIELADSGLLPEETPFQAEGGTAHRAKGGTGNPPASTINPNSFDSGVGGGSGFSGGGGGGGGGGTPVPMLTALAVCTEEPCDAGVTDDQCEDGESKEGEACKNKDEETAQGGDDGSDDGNGDGSDDGNGDGSDDGNGDGSDDGNSDGSDDGNGDGANGGGGSGDGSGPCGDLTNLSSTTCETKPVGTNPPGGGSGDPAVTVDEPGPLSLLLVGGLALLLSRRARRKSA